MNRHIEISVLAPLFVFVLMFFLLLSERANSSLMSLHVLRHRYTNHRRQIRPEFSVLRSGLLGWKYPSDFVVGDVVLVRHFFKLYIICFQGKFVSQGYSVVNFLPISINWHLMCRFLRNIIGIRHILR